MKRVILHHISQLWQESWSQQLDNKLHSVKPVIVAWPVMPMRRTDVKLTRLRIGHTRFTHRHLLLGEDAPERPSCKWRVSLRGQRPTVPNSIYATLEPQMHEQMFWSGGQSEARPTVFNWSGGQSEARSTVFKSPSKLGTHLSTHCIRDERQSQPCRARE
ncbi:RNase H domain-containing protein [Trichonephila clavipes]|uniref:RNase H domain-containing protein n=1 Tax=Trichonephila clavipes TaxID=2585209 RepID=A0A8X6SP24_TRICX|nr:RNase H domain-containing protein [Trichonephila clavipes]